MAVQVAERRREVEPEPGDLLGVEAGRVALEQVGERLAVERLEDHDGLRALDHLVRAHEVRVRERQQPLALGQQRGAGRGLAGAIGAQDLGDAAAAALVAPHLVGVEPALRG